MSLRQSLDPENPLAMWDWVGFGLPSALLTGTHRDKGSTIDWRTGEVRQRIFCVGCGVEVGTIRGWDCVIYFCDKCEHLGASLIFPECSPAYNQYLEHQLAEARRAG